MHHDHNQLFGKHIKLTEMTNSFLANSFLASQLNLQSVILLFFFHSGNDKSKNKNQRDNIFGCGRIEKEKKTEQHLMCLEEWYPA